MAPPPDAGPAPVREWSGATGTSRIFPAGIGFGFELSEDGMSATGDATITDALRPADTSLPRASVLATIADCVAGIPAHRMTAPRLSVTLDIAVRLVAPGCGDQLDVQGEIVKKGRSTMASEVRFLDAQNGTLVAHSYVTFMTSPRPQDRTPALSRGMRTTGSMAVALPEHVGAQIVAPGVVEIERTPLVVQAAGSLQGGLVALLGELAAESLTGSFVLDLDIRYLSAVRIGPGRATATLLGDRLVRAEVRDVGRDDRLTAVVVARVAPEG
jgi:acyl-coenzyme A thioesterase PaaI-like protein